MIVLWVLDFETNQPSPHFNHVHCIYYSVLCNEDYHIKPELVSINIHSTCIYMYKDFYNYCAVFDFLAFILPYSPDTRRWSPVLTCGDQTLSTSSPLPASLRCNLCRVAKSSFSLFQIQVQSKQKSIYLNKRGLRLEDHS